MKYGRRAKVLLPLCLLGFTALCAWRMWPRDGQSTVVKPTIAATLELSGPTMGTTWKVTIVGTLSDQEQAAVTDLITRELAAVDVQMSTWRPDSEISSFNASSSTAPFKASRGFVEVVALALEIHAASGGAFDVTLAPLIDAWGFGPSGKPAIVPTAEQLAALRARTGADKLHVDLAANTITKDLPGLSLELSAVAPGYAADRIAAGLTALGHANHMVDVGGEFRVTGESPQGGPWRLGIERPDSTGGVVHEVVLLTDQSLATSGDYRNYYEQDGVRLSHTLDPKTARPIAHKLASVSVIHRSAALADGWATALNVLGPDAGLALAEQQAIPALFLVRQADGSFAERTTTPFATLRPDRPRATLGTP